MEDVGRILTYTCDDPDAPDYMRHGASHLPPEKTTPNWTTHGHTAEEARTKLHDFLTGVAAQRRAAERKARKDAEKAAAPPPVEVRKMVARVAPASPAAVPVAAPRVRVRTKPPEA